MKNRLWTACIAALTLSSVAPGGDLADRIERLETRIRQLEANDPLAGPRADEMRSLIAEVLADADTRASLQDGPVEAGWDDEFYLETADGDFRLEIAGQLQLRLNYNHQSNSREDDDRLGFENRRTKIKFKGHAFGDVEYAIMGAFDDDDGFFELQDANVQFRLADGLKLRVGRARSTLLREESVSSKRQLAVERSLIARTFRQDRSQGFALKYEGDRVRWNVGMADTTRELFGDLQSWHAAGRVEFLLGGERWKPFKDFTSFPEDDPGVAIGFGVLYQDEEHADPLEDDLSFIRWTADISVELGGANVFAAFVGNHEDEEQTPTRDQYGVIVHGGVFVTDHVELFARYVWGDSDLDEPDLSVLTLGVNRYLDGHALKWTNDVSYGFNEITKFWESGSAAFRDDTPGEDGQVVVRSQFQLLF